MLPLPRVITHPVQILDHRNVHLNYLNVIFKALKIKNINKKASLLKHKWDFLFSGLNMRVAMDKQTEHFNRVHTQTQHGKDTKIIPKAHFDINNSYIFSMNDSDVAAADDDDNDDDDDDDIHKHYFLTSVFLVIFHYFTNVLHV